MKRLLLLIACLFPVGLPLWGQVIFGPTSLPNGILGDTYSQTLTPTGGYGLNGLYTVTLASGTLPDGVTFSSPASCDELCGLLSGTLTATGTFTFTVQAVSYIPNSAFPPITGTQAYTIVVYPVLAITTPTTISGAEGVPFSQTFTATGGAGSSTYTWSLVPGFVPPPGLTLSAAGVLSGTPTAQGNYYFVVQVASQVPDDGTVTATLGVSASIGIIPPTFTGSLGNGVVGLPYSGTLGAEGGYGSNGVYTFSVAFGTVPPGTNFSAGGTLSGTPTAVGTYSFTAKVISSIPNSQFTPLVGMQDFTVTIYPVLAITTPSANPGDVGIPYSQTWAATGGAGAATYTWSLVPGSTPPPGLTLSAAGVFSGTPTAQGTYFVIVQVSSQVPNYGALAATLSATITINLVPPTITGSLTNGVVGVPYSGTLGAVGGYGSNGVYTFSVASGTQPPGTNLSAGGTLSGTPTAAGVYNFTVQVVSHVPNTPILVGTQPFTVTIYPALAITTASANSGNVGIAYSQTFAATGGGGPATYTWSLAPGSTPPPGLTFSAAGVLSGTPTTAGIYSIPVQVTSQIPNFGTLTASLTFSTVIAATPSPAIAGSLPNGVVGLSYSATLGASGGYGPGTYTFSLASGTVPTGTTLSSSGTLSGSPTAGTYSFTVQLTSTYPTSGAFPLLTTTQSYTVVVYPALAITTQTASSGTVSFAYSQTFAASGGAGPSTYAWSVISGTPPPGLTLSAAGALSGTPTSSGTFSFSVQVLSQVPTVGPQTASQTFTIAIAPITPLAIAGNLGGDIVGVPYSATLGASGGYGAGTYTFSLASGTLPPGITLSAGGALSGTPTAAGTSNFTVQLTSTYPTPVANFPPLTATQSYSITVYPILAIPSQTASSGTVGAAYSQTFTATGGAGPSGYAWSVISGTPPPGLTLSAAGTLSGIPTAAGTFSFSVQVLSQIPTLGAQTASQAFSVSIAAVPALAITGSLGNGTVGLAYSATLGATGGYGTGTYTFSLASGTLPPGITLSAGGTLSGTPTAAATYNFTVQLASTYPNPAANVPSLTATQSFTIVVYPSLAITLQTANSGTVGVAYSQTFTAAGGAGASTYAWSLASGTPPPGLVFSTAGVLSGTPTAAGTFSFSVQVSSQVPTLGTQTASQAFSVAIAAVPPPSITGSLGNDTAGVPYTATLGATGGYASGTYTFALTTGALPGGITLSAGGTLSGTPVLSGTSTFTVQVTSTLASPGASFPPLTATRPFAITVYPVLQMSPQTLMSGSVGYPYSFGLAVIGGGGVSSYTWSVTSGTLPPGVTLSAAGGFSGVPLTAGTYTFTAQVSSQVPNVGTQTASQTLSIVISADPPLTVTGVPSVGVVGAYYGASFAPTGGYGNGTYAYSLASGTLPPGVTFVNGAMTGIPTAAGTYTFSVQITNALIGAGASLPPLIATQSFTVTIYPSLAITPPAASSGTVGVAYSQTFTASGGGGASTYTWAATGTPPPGLTLSATGVLGGTPTSAGSFTFNVSVTSQVPTVGSLATSQAFTVAITGVSQPGITGSLGAGMVGVPYSAVTLGVTGGYGSGAFSLASGGLPPGITLSTGGTVSGTPTAGGTFTFTAQVTSTQTVNGVSLPPLTGTQAFTVVVYPALAIAPPAVNFGSTGIAYSQAFTASGGAGASTYTWSVASGAPPAGLTLSAAGVLSGTPTTSGNFTFTVQVSSPIPTVGTQTASLAFSFAIAPRSRLPAAWATERWGFPIRRRSAAPADMEPALTRSRWPPGLCRST